MMAEAEVRSLMHLRDVDGANHDLARKLAGRLATERFGERKHKRGVDTRVRQQFQLALQWRNQRPRLLGAEDTRRMRVEGDGQGESSQKPRARDHLRNHSLMAKMHAVEVADGGHNRGGRGREFCELAIDFHCGLIGFAASREMSNVICRPS